MKGQCLGPPRLTQNCKDRVGLRNDLQLAGQVGPRFKPTVSGQWASQAWVLPRSLQDKVGWPMSPPPPIHTPSPHTDHPCMAPPAPIALPGETATPSSLKTGSSQSQPRTMDPSETHDRHVLPVSSLSQLAPSSFPLRRWPSPTGSTKLFFPPSLPSALYIRSATTAPFSPHSSMLPVPQPPLIQPWPWSVYSSNGLSRTFSPGRGRVRHRTLTPSPEPGRLPGTGGDGVNRMASPPPQPCI